jgi:hypothetical protein
MGPWRTPRPSGRVDAHQYDARLRVLVLLELVANPLVGLLAQLKLVIVGFEAAVPLRLIEDDLQLDLCIGGVRDHRGGFRVTSDKEAPGHEDSKGHGEPTDAVVLLLGMPARVLSCDA